MIHGVVPIQYRLSGIPTVLTSYLKAAMRRATYEILPDDGSYYGEIPECQGVLSNAKTLEECRDELEQVLEEWVLFRIHQHLPLPVLDGIGITVKEAAV